MLKTVAAIAVLALAGCATTQPQQVKISALFDEVAAAEAMKPGTNTVNGNAFLRQRGGGVVTCAGADVALFPATAYAIERMRHLYDGTFDGVRSVSQHREKLQFDPDPATYKSLARQAKCDAQGKFTFDRVSDGEWFVATAVVWSTGQYNTEGGTLMHRFTVRGGETKNLVIGR